MSDNTRHSPSGRDNPPDQVARVDHPPPNPQPITRATSILNTSTDDPPVEVISSSENFLHHENTSDLTSLGKENEETGSANGTKLDSDSDNAGAEVGDSIMTVSSSRHRVEKGVVEHQQHQQPAHNVQLGATIAQNSGVSGNSSETEKNQKNDPKNKSSEQSTIQPPKGFLKRIRFEARSPEEQAKATRMTDEADLHFLRNETKPNNIGENANFKLAQSRRIFERKSKTSNFLDFLNTLPENELSMKFDVKNQFDISISHMESALENVYMDKKNKILKQIKALLVQGVSFEDESMMEKSKGEEHHIRLNQMRELVSAAVACIFIANTRIIKNKAYLMCAKSYNTIAYIVSSLVPGFQKENVITEEDVSNQIIALLTNEYIFEVAGAEKYFSVERSPTPSGRFVWATVSFLPMKGSQDYFEQMFLSPGDVVTGWVVDESPSPNGKVYVDVTIDLGSDKTPPRRLIMDRIKQHLQFLLTYNKGDKLIQEDKKKLIEILALNDGKETSVSRAFQASIENAEQHAATFKTRLTGLISKNQAHRQYEVRDDPAQMSCTIEYMEQYCPICHTTAHPLRTCPVRGCSICRKTDHPWYKCPSKCNCGQKPLHVEKDCMKGRPQQISSPKKPAATIPTPVLQPAPKASLASKKGTRWVQMNQFAQVLQNEDQPEEEVIDLEEATSEAASSAEESMHSVSSTSESDHSMDGESMDSSVIISPKKVSQSSSSKNATPTPFANIHIHKNTPTQTPINSPQSRPASQTTVSSSMDHSSMSSIGSFTTASGYHVPSSSSKKDKGQVRPEELSTNGQTTLSVSEKEPPLSPMPSMGGSLITASGTRISDDHVEGRAGESSSTDSSKGSNAVVVGPELPQTPQSTRQTPKLIRISPAKTPRVIPKTLVPGSTSWSTDTDADSSKDGKSNTIHNLKAPGLQAPFQEPVTVSTPNNKISPTRRLSNLSGQTPGTPQSPRRSPRKLVSTAESAIKSPSKRILSETAPQSPVKHKMPTWESSPSKSATTTKAFKSPFYSSSPFNWADTEPSQTSSSGSEPNSEVTSTQKDTQESAPTENKNDNDL